MKLPFFEEGYSHHKKLFELTIFIDKIDENEILNPIGMKDFNRGIDF